MPVSFRIIFSILTRETENLLGIFSKPLVPPGIILSIIWLKISSVLLRVGHITRKIAQDPKLQTCDYELKKRTPKPFYQYKRLFELSAFHWLVKELLKRGLKPRVSVVGYLWYLGYKDGGWSWDFAVNKNSRWLTLSLICCL